MPLLSRSFCAKSISLENMGFPLTLAPFLAAPPHIQSHILAAMLVLALTPVQFFGPRKGSAAHRAAGYVWLFAMLIVALTSFFIRSSLPVSLAGFSPIHLLSVLALFSIVTAIRHAQAHRISAHRKTLIYLTIGFLIAGAFTLTPDRIMGRIAFGLG
jgi:uncharacterized membrane protein